MATNLNMMVQNPNPKIQTNIKLSTLINYANDSTYAYQARAIEILEMLRKRKVVDDNIIKKARKKELESGEGGNTQDDLIISLSDGTPLTTKTLYDNQDEYFPIILENMNNLNFMPLIPHLPDDMLELIIRNSNAPQMKIEALNYINPERIRFVISELVDIPEAIDVLVKKAPHYILERLDSSYKSKLSEDQAFDVKSKLERFDTLFDKIANKTWTRDDLLEFREADSKPLLLSLYESDKSLEFLKDFTPETVSEFFKALLEKDSYVYTYSETIDVYIGGNIRDDIFGQISDTEDYAKGFGDAVLRRIVKDDLLTQDRFLEFAKLNYTDEEINSAFIFDENGNIHIADEDKFSNILNRIKALYSFSAVEFKRDGVKIYSVSNPIHNLRKTKILKSQKSYFASEQEKYDIVDTLLITNYEALLSFIDDINIDSEYIDYNLLEYIALNIGSDGAIKLFNKGLSDGLNAICIKNMSQKDIDNLTFDDFKIVDIYNSSKLGSNYNSLVEYMKRIKTADFDLSIMDQLPYVAIAAFIPRVKDNPKLLDDILKYHLKNGGHDYRIFYELFKAFEPRQYETILGGKFTSNKFEISNFAKAMTDVITEMPSKFKDGEEHLQKIYNDKKCPIELKTAINNALAFNKSDKADEIANKEEDDKLIKDTKIPRKKRQNLVNSKVKASNDINKGLDVVNSAPDDLKGGAIEKLADVKGNGNVSIDKAVDVIDGATKEKEKDIDTEKEGIDTEKEHINQLIDNAGKMITFDDAEKVVREFFTEDEIDVKKAVDLFSKDKAFGSYLDNVISMVENPDITTPYHESVHAYLDNFYSSKEKAELFNQLREDDGITEDGKKYADCDNRELEEVLADMFYKYLKTKRQPPKTLWEKIKDFFERAFNFIKSLVGKRDLVKQLFDDIDTHKRPVKTTKHIVEGLMDNGLDQDVMDKDIDRSIILEYDDEYGDKWVNGNKINNKSNLTFKDGDKIVGNATFLMNDETSFIQLGDINSNEINRVLEKVLGNVETSGGNCSFESLKMILNDPKFSDLLNGTNEEITNNVLNYVDNINAIRNNIENRIPVSKNSEIPVPMKLLLKNYVPKTDSQKFVDIYNDFVENATDDQLKAVMQLVKIPKQIDKAVSYINNIYPKLESYGIMGEYTDKNGNVWDRMLVLKGNNAKAYQEFADPFYSELTRGINSLHSENIVVQRLPKLLKNATLNEMNWSGILDFANENAVNGIITKTQLMDYIKENGVKVDLLTEKSDKALDLSGEDYKNKLMYANNKTLENSFNYGEVNQKAFEEIASKGFKKFPNNLNVYKGIVNIINKGEIDKYLTNSSIVSSLLSIHFPFTKEQLDKIVNKKHPEYSLSKFMTPETAPEIYKGVLDGTFYLDKKSLEGSNISKFNYPDMNMLYNILYNKKEMFENISDINLITNRIGNNYKIKDKYKIALKSAIKDSNYSITAFNNFKLLDIDTEDFFDMPENYKNFDELDYEEWEKLPYESKLSENFIKKYFDKIGTSTLFDSGNVSMDTAYKYADQLNWTWISQYKILTPEQIDKFADKLNWKWVSEKQKLNTEQIDKYADKLDLKLVSKFQALTPEQINKFANFLDWNSVSRYQKLTSDQIDKFADKLDLDLVSQYQTLTPEQIDKFANKLNWKWVSEKQKLNTEQMEKFADKLNWELVSQYQKLTAEQMEKFADNLDWEIISKYQTLTPEQIDKFADKLDLDLVSRYQKLTTEQIDKFADKLDLDLIAETQKLTTEQLEKFADKLDWGLVSRYQKLDTEQLEKFADKLDWGLVSQYQKLTIEQMEKFADKLNWNIISQVQKLTTEQMEKFANKLNWKNIIYYQGLTTEQMEKFADKLDWIYISQVQKLTTEQMEKFADKLDLKYISKYNELTTEQMEKFADKLNLEYISKYKQLTPEQFDKFVDKLDWDLVSKYQKLTTEQIDKFADKLDWDLVSKYQKLTTEQMEKFADKLNWINIFEFQKLTPEQFDKFANNFDSKLDWEIISQYQKLNKEQMEKFADKLDWDLVSQYQTLTSDQIDKFADKINWLYAPINNELTSDQIDKYANKIKLAYKNNFYKLGYSSLTRYNDALGAMISTMVINNLSYNDIKSKLNINNYNKIINILYGDTKADAVTTEFLANSINKENHSFSQSDIRKRFTYSEDVGGEYMEGVVVSNKSEYLPIDDTHFGELPFNEGWFLGQKYDSTLGSVLHLSELQTKRVGGGDTKVPSPFGEKYHEIILKNMIKYAIENNLDGISFNTGYDLSNRYGKLMRDVSNDELTFSKKEDDDDSYIINTKFEDGSTETKEMNKAEISAMYGGGFLGRMEDHFKDENNKEYTINQRDVLNSDKFFSDLYDNKIPNFLNKYMRRLGVDTRIEVKEVKPNVFKPYLKVKGDLSSTILKHGQPLFQKTKYQEAIDNILKNVNKEDLHKYADHKNAYVRRAIAQNISVNELNLFQNDNSPLVRDIIYERGGLDLIVNALDMDINNDSLPALRKRLAKLLKNTSNFESKDIEILKEKLNKSKDAILKRVINYDDLFVDPIQRKNAISILDLNSKVKRGKDTTESDKLDKKSKKELVELQLKQREEENPSFDFKTKQLKDSLRSSLDANIKINNEVSFNYKLNDVNRTTITYNTGETFDMPLASVDSFSTAVTDIVKNNKFNEIEEQRKNNKTTYLDDIKNGAIVVQNDTAYYLHDIDPNKAHGTNGFYLEWELGKNNLPIKYRMISKMDLPYYYPSKINNKEIPEYRFTEYEDLKAGTELNFIRLNNQGLDSNTKFIVADIDENEDILVYNENDPDHSRYYTIMHEDYEEEIEFKERLNEIRSEYKDIPMSDSMKEFSNTPIDGLLKVDGSGSNNEVYICTNNGKNVGIFKPILGEPDEVWNNIGHANQQVNEVFSSYFDNLVGFNLVPNTVLKEIDGKLGSYQQYADSDGSAGENTDLFSELKTERQKLLLFDLLTMNADRHYDNALIKRDDKKIIAIDNGYSMPINNNIPRFKTDVYRDINDFDDVPNDISNKLHSFDTYDKIKQDFYDKGLIKPTAFRDFLKRAFHVIGMDERLNKFDIWDIYDGLKYDDITVYDDIDLYMEAIENVCNNNVDN